jgi:hypothetical protein
MAESRSQARNRRRVLLSFAPSLCRAPWFIFDGVLRCGSDSFTASVEVGECSFLLQHSVCAGARTSRLISMGLQTHR